MSAELIQYLAAMFITPGVALAVLGLFRLVRWARDAVLS